MTLIVKKYVPANPIDVCFFRPDAQVAGTDESACLIEQLWHGASCGRGEPDGNSGEASNGDECEAYFAGTLSLAPCKDKAGVSRSPN